MVAAVRARVSDSAGTLGSVFRNRSLRRIEIARAVVALSVASSSVVFLVVAFRAGGAAAVATLAVVRTIALTIAAPFGALLGDRYRRNVVMAVADGVRTLALLATALAAAADVGLVAIFALAALATVIGTASAPARAALIPEVARTPEELAAANAVASTSENVISFLGPAAGALALGLFGAATAFTLGAAASAVSALLVLGIGTPTATATARLRPRGRREALAGFEIIVRDRVARLILAVYAAETLAGAAVGVLLVPAADELLGLGDSGVGYLFSAMGVGGIVGAALALTLGEGRLGKGMAWGFLVWGSATALVGVWPVAALAILLFALSGIGDSVVDVTGLTLAQRRIPNEVLARVGGASTMILLFAATVGNLAGPLLLHVFGLRTALVVAGAVVPATAILWWRPVSRLDASAPAALPTVRAVSLFAPLPLPVLEQLAGGAARRAVAAGERVFAQGDAGDRFYVVVDGEVEIAVDGRIVATAERNEYFGEIALLRDVPRTGTATAVRDSSLVAIEREDFLRALSGHQAALAAAEDVVTGRLAPGLPAAVSAPAPAS